MEQKRKTRTSKLNPNNPDEENVVIFVCSVVVVQNHRLLKMVPKGLKQVLLICIALFLTVAVEARSRRNPACNEDQQKKMTEEFNLCLNKFTKEHHEATGKATTAEQYQVRIQSLFVVTEKTQPYYLFNHLLWIPKK